MKNNSFRTYQKSSKIRISYGTIFAVICFGSIFALLINQELSFLQSDFIDNLFRIVGITSLLLLIYKTIKSFNEIEQLNGKITGVFKLFPDKIILNNQIIFITDVANLNINLTDYNGKRFNGLINTWLPSLSNGFGNSVSIYLKTTDKIEAHFEQKYEGEFVMKNKDILIDYHKNGKLSFLNLLDILEIESYDEIKAFKNAL